MSVFIVYCDNDYNYESSVLKAFSTEEKANNFILKWKERNPDGYEKMTGSSIYSSIYNIYNLCCEELKIDEEE